MTGVPAGVGDSEISPMAAVSGRNSDAITMRWLLNELIVVGDRIFTDVVMANRMARKQAVPSNGTPQDIPASEKSQQTTASSKQERVGPLSIWTTGVWEREAMPMRFLEKSFTEAIRRHVVAENGVRVLGGDVTKFVKPEPAKEAPPTPRPGLASRIWQRIRR